MNKNEKSTGIDDIFVGIVRVAAIVYFGALGAYVWRFAPGRASKKRQLACGALALERFIVAIEETIQHRLTGYEFAKR